MMYQTREEKYNKWHSYDQNLFLRGDAEVYIGKSAGKQLSQAIMSAKEEVIVISPYIDHDGVDDLIKLHNRGVRVFLCFSHIDEKNKQVILKRLVKQKQTVNHVLLAEKDKKMQRYSMIGMTSLILGIFGLMFPFVYMIFTKQFVPVLTLLTVLGILSFLNLWVISGKKKNIRKIPVYSYEYEKTLNFKYVRENNRPFVHSKIYVIDKEIAFVGSVNFTRAGFMDNFETRVRLKEPSEIQKLRDFALKIIEDDEFLKGHEDFFMGRYLYQEPPF